MVRAVVRNWRCIENLELELSPITLFIGRNSSGKSSLAYALYFLTKVVEWRDANKVLTHLYGVDLDGVVRADGNKRYYPIVIEADDNRFEAYGRDKVVIPSRSPWTSSYLLPATRISLFNALQFIGTFVREPPKRPENRMTSLLIHGLIEFIKNVPLPPPTYFFLEDLMRIYGIVLRREMRMGDLGTLVEVLSPFTILIYYEYIDPYNTDLKLPLYLAPDGFIDSAIIRRFVERAREGSLIVIEEPEIHKNPLWIVDLVKDIVRVAVDRKLTLVMTTHSDILLHAVAKAVEEKRISHEHVSVYYLYRDHQEVWSRARKLKVYEDGTFEELPGVEEVISKLF